MDSINEQARDAAIKAGAADAIPVGEAGAVMDAARPKALLPVKGDRVTISGIEYVVKFVDRAHGEIRLAIWHAPVKPVEVFVGPV